MGYTPPTPIIKPFCNSGSLVTPPSGTSTTVANQETGYPPLQATPLNSGGIPVNIQQTNGIHNFYSEQILSVIAGTQFTFNQSFVDEGGVGTNGYPAGAILYCASNKSYQISLVNNNIANFITTTTYINDGINWLQIFPLNTITLTTSTDITTFSPAIFNTVFYSTFSNNPYNTTTGLFTVPVTGNYKITANLAIYNSTGSAQSCTVFFFADNSSIGPTPISFAGTQLVNPTSSPAPDIIGENHVYEASIFAYSGNVIQIVVRLTPGDKILGQGTVDTFTCNLSTLIFTQES